MPEILCPECGLPAEIKDRFTLWSTDGPIEHVRTSCDAGHVLTPPAEDLSWEGQRAATEAERRASRRAA